MVIEQPETVISKYLEDRNANSFFLREPTKETGKDALIKEITITDQNGKDKTDFLVKEPVFIRFQLKINRNRGKYQMFVTLRGG